MADDMDLSEFQDVFFEECFEGLDVMEEGLLGLGDQDTDVEKINRIFRAAHSIKGGGGTFGFPAISEFTHVVETLLDQMRSGVRYAEQSVVDLLLESVDCLRGMIKATQANDPIDGARNAYMQERLQNVLSDIPAFEEKTEDKEEQSKPEELLSGKEEDLVAEESVAASKDSRSTQSDRSNGNPDNESAKGVKQERALQKEGGSIRVSIEKVDNLINLVGELVITQSMLSRFGGDFDLSMVEALRDGLNQLARNTRELQENAMQIRMLPISFAFSRIPRLVRDLGHQLKKKVEVNLVGAHTELDKTVLEKIGDPLLHLVRNSLDHGIESSEVRKELNKPAVATVTLSAYQEGGNIVIEVKDDGAGLNTEKILKKALEKGLIGEDETLTDKEINNLIFMPGFSTVDKVTDISGRGVGMDVVRRNINDLGGTVEVTSTAGQGSVFTIRLPLSLAILDGQLVRVGSEIYIISLLSIIESLQTTPELVNNVAGQTELFKLRDEYIPVIRLHQLYGIPSNSQRLEDGLLVVVEADRQRVGILVDELMGQQQVVIKSLETNFCTVDGLAGATILGDGTVALIIDVPGLIRKSRLARNNVNLTNAA